ncbi:hypothetical protein M0813_07511 [Anaeramoeba flamelloides]|uniref:Uncharacterized protein n=1 Tax=Anaeramoeba flamelloides TaxID=1746091 RepID=A0ABQ8XDM5_9EUKA|nr:hypothetical protein M0813_07511 [Anaeramoeba flamelloides]
MSFLFFDNLILRNEKEILREHLKPNNLNELEEIVRKRRLSQTRAPRRVKKKKKNKKSRHKTNNSWKKQSRTNKLKPYRKKEKKIRKEKGSDHNSTTKKILKNNKPRIQNLNQNGKFYNYDISEPKFEKYNNLIRTNELFEHKNTLAKKKRDQQIKPIQYHKIHPRSNSQSKDGHLSGDPRKYLHHKQKLMVYPRKLFKNLKNTPMNTSNKQRTSPFTFQKRNRNQKPPIKAGNPEETFNKVFITFQQKNSGFKTQPRLIPNEKTNNTNDHTQLKILDQNIDVNDKNKTHSECTSKEKLYYIANIKNNKKNNYIMALCKIINPIDYKSSINFVLDTQFTEYIKTSFIEVLFNKRNFENTKIQVGDLLEISPSKFQINNNSFVGINSIICTHFMQKNDHFSKNILDRINQDKDLQINIQKVISFYENPNYSIFLANPRRKPINISKFVDNHSSSNLTNTNTNFPKIENLCPDFRQLSLFTRNILVRCIDEFYFNKIRFWIIHDRKQVLALIQIPEHIKHKLPLMCKLCSVTLIKWQARLNLEFSKLISTSLNSITPISNIILIGTNFDFKIMIIESKK